MFDTSAATTLIASGTTTPSLLEQQARKLVFGKLKTLREGKLYLREEGLQEDRIHHFGREADDRLRADLVVRDPSFWTDIAIGGTIGACESYMNGAWESDDLVEVIRLLVRNRDAMDELESGWARLQRPLHLLAHRLRSNTRSGSRRNIREHYDLGNDFYKLFLDREMMYSSAIFEEPGMTLDQASRAKLDRICRKLRLAPHHHVLEIGTGWGGFAIWAARNYGCRVTTTTISRAQWEYAVERVRQEGLEDQVEVLQRDYRDLEGRYDRLVSIEMIEAVGLKHLPTFFRVCGERLKADGEMFLQAITIADRYYEQAARSVDFIQRYIFPGSGIPSIASMAAAMAGSSDLTVTYLEDFGADYAKTLHAWRERFHRRLETVRELGYSERFQRMWDLYLSYCEGGFKERSIGVAQMHLVKPWSEHMFMRTS